MQSDLELGISGKEGVGVADSYSPASLRGELFPPTSSDEMWEFPEITKAQVRPPSVMVSLR